jgi:dTDP-glucose 4,6-dehydratase
LPLDKRFAVGNFLRSAIDGKEIIVKGDGSPFRSYIYTAEMAAWIWGVLLRGRPGRAYNIGSEEKISIFSLAKRVVHALKANVNVRVTQTVSSTKSAQYYVPNTHRATKELGLSHQITLDDALLRTAIWHGYSLHSGEKDL